MTSDLDIYRSANVLVKRHGQDAPIQAAMRADAMPDKGDLDGFSVWKRILRAVGELQGTGPKPGGVGSLIGPAPQGCSAKPTAPCCRQGDFPH